MKKSNITKKKDCHPILADYGEDQFSIRINNKGEDIQIKPLDSFSFQYTVPFETRDLQRIKQNHFYNNQPSSMTLIILVMKKK